MNRRRAAQVLLWALLATLATGAAARPPSAESLYRQGAELFARGLLDESVAVLERARRRTANLRLVARIELHLGLNAATQGRTPRAREHFRQAIRHDPALRVDPAQYKPELVALYEELRAEEAAVARRLLGPVPAPVRAAPADAAPPAPRRAPSTAGPAATPSPGPPRGPRRPTRRRIWTWVAGGAAFAAGATALGLGLAARADYREACGMLVDGGQDCAARRELAPGSEPSRFAQLHERVARESLAANIAWGVAGALAATSAVLFFLERRPRRAQPEAAAPTLRLGLGPALRVDASF